MQEYPYVAKRVSALPLRSETAIRLLHLREDFLQAQGGSEGSEACEAEGYQESEVRQEEGWVEGGLLLQ